MSKLILATTAFMLTVGLTGCGDSKPAAPKEAPKEPAPAAPATPATPDKPADKPKP